ncbi:MAG: hypothetical protein ACJ76V_16105 [Thermoleophilaceae bacterium]
MTRALAILLSLTRIAFGVGSIANPESTSRYWAGRKPSKRIDTKLFARGFGARDVVLGLGALLALVRRDPQARLWMAAQAISEGADLGTTFAEKDKIPDAALKRVTAVTGASFAGALWSAFALRGRYPASPPLGSA